jgi:hypothetical protein
MRTQTGFTDAMTPPVVDAALVEARVRASIDELLKVALAYARAVSQKTRRGRLERGLLMGAYDALAQAAGGINRVTDPDLYEVDATECLRQDEVDGRERT